MAAEALGAYFSLLLRWNAKINLTGLSTVEEAIDRILLEPISAAAVIGSGTASLIDIGSGGGSPAIPLRIVRPNLKVWMVESKGRKAAFLRECVRELGLTDVFVENARAEELLTRPALTESMDYASVRAVRLDARLLNTMQAFVRPGGSLLLFGTRDTNVDERLGELTVVECRDLLDRSGSSVAVLRKKSVP
jgi:16S rRNA (guanine527-N7)-methyltransferase